MRLSSDCEWRDCGPDEPDHTRHLCRPSYASVKIRTSAQGEPVAILRLPYDRPRRHGWLAQLLHESGANAA
jgi:hypothetical protein